MNEQEPWTRQCKVDCSSISQAFCNSCGIMANRKPLPICQEPRHAARYAKVIERSRASYLKNKRLDRPQTHRKAWTRWVKDFSCEGGVKQAARVCITCGRLSRLRAADCVSPQHQEAWRRQVEYSAIHHKTKRFTNTENPRHKEIIDYHIYKSPSVSATERHLGISKFIVKSEVARHNERRCSCFMDFGEPPVSASATSHEEPLLLQQ